MKTPTLAGSLGLLTLGACLLFVPGVRAGLTFNVDVYRSIHGTFYNFYTPLSTNTTPPDAPVGMYFINSPQWPTNGSTRQYQITTNGFNPNPVGGQETGYSDYASMMEQITNGTWTILYTNCTTTNLYTFTVSAPGMTSNMMPATIITYPSDGALNIPNQPTLTWMGPTNFPLNNSYTYVANYDFSFIQYANIPSTQTNWTLSIPDGINCNFAIDYLTNYASLFVATTPLSANNSQPIAGWISTSTVESGDSVSFAVTNPPATGITLVAHYTFANSGNLGQDSSGNGYDLDFNGGDGVTSSSAAIAGGGAAYFDGGSFFSYTSTPGNVLSTLAGDFSLSFWIETTQNNGNEGGDAWAGAGIMAADVPISTYDIVPAALDGGEIGFNTGPDDDTLNSQGDINDGNYHHVVITRDQATGEKQIYIDGVLNTSDSATMNPLSSPHMVAIGCQIDASQTDPNNANPNNYFQGLLDDMQLYSGVLSSSQVAALYANPGSTATGSNSGSGGGHTLIAHYTFDNSGFAGMDSSGNGNDIACGSSWGTNYDVFSTDAIAGGGAHEFFGDSSMTPCGQAFTSWTNTLAGSFTVSAWIATTNVVGNDGDDLYDYSGQSVVYADNNNLGATPIGLTGTRIAFRTTDPDGNDDTLHSKQCVTTGNYIHVVATRDQNTGEKKIYINGVLDNCDIASAESLTGDQYNSIGGVGGSPYSGLVDDVQIYSGVLSSNDVAYLYNNPGMTVANVSGGTGPDFNTALGTTNLEWSTSGDTSWFVETTYTSDGSPSAAQSGVVTNNQSSTISVTVTGPGTLTFDWSSEADYGGNFDYEFAMDGNDEDDIYYDTGWYQDGPFTIPAGTHVLTWTTYAYGDDDPTEAGFLDDVSYIPETVPTITSNPFSQTNYPGYPVWLSASSPTNNNVSWQWYEVGPGEIPGATSSYYIPTNSGAPGVAGSYYAVASNDAGSANTTTAAVTFVTAPLPPNWSIAFKSPLEPQDDSQETKDYYYGCCTDTNGNIYTAAEFGGNVQVGAINLESGTGGDAAAIVKQTPSGVSLWAVGITNYGVGSSYAYDVAPAPAGGVYVAGNYNGDNWLGTNQLTDNGNGNIFVAAFNASGSNLWVETFGGTNQDFITINTLAADPAGNVTVCGLLGNGPVTIGSSNYMVSGQEGFIAQLDQTGAVRWSQLLPSGSPQCVICSGGRLYFSINTAVNGGTTNVFIGGVTNITDRGWAVACLNDTNGQAIWIDGVGAQYDSYNGNPYFASVIDDVPKLAVSGTNLFMTGVAYASSASFGALTVNFGDLRGQYFARYDTNGNAIVATAYGSVTTTPNAAVANARGDLYVSGVFDADSFFGDPLIAAPIATRLYNGDFSQAFLAKFDMNGNPLWADEAVSPVTVNFLGITLASDGVWASGWCQSGYYPQVEYTQFGTNDVFSSGQDVEGGSGGSFNIIWYPAGVLAKVTDTGTSATPVTLINAERNGVNFQFQFLSESGFSHNILYRTNLLVGNWQTNSTIMGDGTLKTISIPMALFSPSHQGYIEVSTQ